MDGERKVTGRRLRFEVHMGKPVGWVKMLSGLPPQQQHNVTLHYNNNFMNSRGTNLHVRQELARARGEGTTTNSS